MALILQIASLIAAGCSIITVIIAIVFFLAVIKNNQVWFEKILKEHKEDHDKRFKDQGAQIQTLFDRQTKLKTDFTETKSSIPKLDKLVYVGVCEVITAELKNNINTINKSYDGIRKDMEAVKMNTFENKQSLEHINTNIDELLSRINKKEDKKE